MTYVLALPGAVLEELRKPRVEPLKRMVGGRYGWAIHRFPIKGGIPVADTIGLDLARPNPMWHGMRVQQQDRIA